MSEEVAPEAPVPVAVIDIGASAIRLLVAEVRSDGTTRTLETASRGVRLGRDAFTGGALTTKTVEAACEVLRDFRRVADEYGVREIRAVATSAVRESDNRDTFLDRVALRTGLDVDVLDAAEENRLTFLAVRAAVVAHPEIEFDDALIVEVGGGSADVAFVRKGEPAQSGTYALGAIRVREILVGLSGGHKAWVKALRSHVRNVVKDIRREIPLGKVKRFVGIGGDVRFVARLLAPGDGESSIRIVPREEFLDFTRKLSRRTTDQIVARHDVSFPEAETMGPALLAYREMLRATEAPEVLVPRVSVRDAILAEIARAVGGDADDDLRRQVLVSAESLARKYEADLGHAHRVRDLCERLFDDLADLHRLGEREKTLLLAAAVLHDVGLFVSLRAHHKHGEYLIRASQLFGLGDEQRAIVACVARYHRRATPKPTHPNYASLDRKARLAVSKLGAILRLANALDRDHTGQVRDLRAVEEGKRWILEVDAVGDLDMERLSLEKRSDLFRETFGQEVRLRAGMGQ